MTPVTFDIDGPICVVTIDRPHKRDAVDGATAKRLARTIAAFPQQCMRADRDSAYAQWDLSMADALRQEGVRGVPMVLAEGEAGAARFAAGAGRHGRFEQTDDPVRDGSP